MYVLIRREAPETYREDVALEYICLARRGWDSGFEPQQHYYGIKHGSSVAFEVVAVGSSSDQAKRLKELLVAAVFGCEWEVSTRGNPSLFLHYVTHGVTQYIQLVCNSLLQS